MAITASMVKALRERTGAGMMDCKQALTEADGDLDSAAALLRKRGAASADRKAGRIAAEGVVASVLADDGSKGVLVEVNCETDFVAKDASFVAFARQVAECVFANEPADVEALSGIRLGDDGTVEQARRELVGRIGENIGIRRFVKLTAGDGRQVAGYVHGKRIGVLVEYAAQDPELGHDLAMHVAASRPLCVAESDVPAETLAKEREIYLAQAADSGKPPEIAEKMVAGRLKKYLKEVTLLGQPFVKDPDQSVGALLQARSAQVHGFVRFEVGEGLEKRTDDFVAEVMAQAKGG